MIQQKKKNLRRRIKEKIQKEKTKKEKEKKNQEEEKNLRGRM